MSIFGALYTAVSGLTAQSAAFGNISDNVANSQTVGFKETDTSFIDYITQSSPIQNLPGSVIARPAYTNDVQGTIAASSDPTALAISGNGFFAVNEASGVSTAGVPQFSAVQYYTRTGDFSLDQNGYLKNSANEYLDGWPVDPVTGVADPNALQPIQIKNTQYDPVATNQVTLSANLPATPSGATTPSSAIQVYDSLGTQHTLNINWTQNSLNSWTATITSPDNTGNSVIGTAQIQFGAASGNTVPDGTIGAINNTTGNVTGSSYAPTGEATLTATANFGQGNQPITIDLGAFGSASGVTQFAGTTYDPRSIGQNGAPPGSYDGITIGSDGSVVANYDNGQSKTVAQIPIEMFAAPDALQRQSGQAFTATAQSGLATISAPNQGGTGSLAVGSIEQSNVDISTEFSKLIVAQQAYGASAKVVTTASDMLTAALDMKR